MKKSLAAIMSLAILTMSVPAHSEIIDKDSAIGLGLSLTGIYATYAIGGAPGLAISSGVFTSYTLQSGLCKVVAVQVEKDLASFAAQGKMSPLLNQLTMDFMKSNPGLSDMEALDAIAEFNAEILSSN